MAEQGSGNTSQTTKSASSTRSANRRTSDSAKSKSKNAAAASKPAVARSAAPEAQQGELLPEGKLYYRIGEVSKITGIKPHVLRYWETEFRWMAPPKSRSKQRLYRRKDIEMVLAIKKLLYDERYTIAGARQVIRERGVSRVIEEGVGAAPEIEAAEPVVEAAAASKTEAEAHDLPERIRAVRKELLELRSLLV